MIMTLEKRPGPSKPLPKENGKWTFHIFPNGVAQESGEYDTEEAAADASFKTLRIWEANGQTYGPHGAITSQSVKVVPDPRLES
jgi:hypothetical protein